MSEINSNKSKKICFYYPHVQKMSGGLFYFYTLANFLAENTGYDVYIVNYKSADYTKIFKTKRIATKVKFIDYEETYGVLDENTFFFAYLNMLPMLVECF